MLSYIRHFSTFNYGEREEKTFKNQLHLKEVFYCWCTFKKQDSKYNMVLGCHSFIQNVIFCEVKI